MEGRDCLDVALFQLGGLVEPRAVRRLPPARPALPLALPSPNLPDPPGPIKRLAAAAKAGAAPRSGSEIIQTDRDADMGVGRADAIGCVKGDPTEVGYV